MCTLDAVEAKAIPPSATWRYYTKRALATRDRVVKLVQKSGVTVADIKPHPCCMKRGARLGKKAAIGVVAVPLKYMAPKTGAIWSGYTRVRSWVASAKNRSCALVDSVESSTYGQGGGR
ncbi:hypothetical protein DWV00_11775 [Trinickia dinghuensis]|uniref:Uncharacterized protein n=1 Tax=Trinickia dinghuensis TaxID=2291023 RepID=A0A3D8K0W4_9BURK|nr:hypothetical protein DWV00_11775 [Trinickia dinghuensis]